MTELRERKHGNLYFGSTFADSYMVADPDCEKLAEAMHAMRYGKPTRAQMFDVLAAAQSYVHLFTYPRRTFARMQFADIARAVRSGSKVAGEGER